MFYIAKRFIKVLSKEDGLGTVEIVLLIAVLVALALIFYEAIERFLREILAELFGGIVLPDAAPE